MSKSDNLSKFFGEDARTVILPIDHGTVIPVQGLERPSDLIGSLRDSVDGFVVNLRVAVAFKAALEGIGTVLRT